MPSLPRWFDPVLRALLGLPGRILERLDGGAPIHAELSGPDVVFPLVSAGARHPDAYLALEPGLHHHVHDGAVVAWQRRGRTAFAVGGVNTAPERRVALLRSFQVATAGLGIVRQLLFPLHDGELEHAASAGFEAIQVGVEAWLDLEDCTFVGNRFENVRQMRNRARRRGVEVEEVDPLEVADELRALHTAWLQAKRPSWRMKLLVGSPNLEHPFDRRYFVARTERRIEAFVTVLPGGPGRWGIDVMCRQPDAVSGSMERLLVAVVEALRAEGALQLSLGACPMADVPLRGERRMLRQIFGYLFTSKFGNTLFGFRTLHAFKQKFRPRWEPVYFAASPHLGMLSLYRGCRMWGLY